MIELVSRYNPKEAEDRLYQYWQNNNLFSAKVNPAKKPFTIVIPPPNVTGILHMGHALNNTIQDILIRHKRMNGFEALLMPGTDHAGIATQNVVEKSLAKQGIKRQDLGREKFLEKVWAWKEQYGSTIIRQLKKLGASCDWQRLRFTMDEAYSETVKEVFVKLHKKNLIYRGRYIINWCPRCQTALSDEEAAHKDLEGNLYYIKYPLKSKKGYIVVATTRPETMLGDTAVAVNPKDKRYKSLKEQKVILPLLEREIQIITDELVNPKFGTGAVKVTPAHDINDYEIGLRHKLDFINIMNSDATLNDNAGKYTGLDRFEARENIIAALKERELLEKIVPHKHTVGHCYRCHTIIEPRLSYQWFVKMQPLAKPAIAAVKKGEINFYPKRWTKVYLNWMENIRDWCISRQIWWGHRIPAWYCKNCYKEENSSQPALVKLGNKNEEKPHEKHFTVTIDKYNVGEKLYKAPGLIVSKDKPNKCPDCGSNDIYQDEDVLDTWFSSWLWPFATFYWPFSSQLTVHSSQNIDKQHTGHDSQNTGKQDLEYFYPTSVLVTAPEIIFFWVARMIMAGFEFIGREPFKDVYIHGTVRDIEGKKMSKSLGNIIDPLEIINEYGTDALRFSLIATTAQGQDVYLSSDRFEQGRNFANKIWNASRFILMNIDESLIKKDLCIFFEKEDLNITNRWILSRFYSTLTSVNKYFDAYKFNEAANTSYSFFWHEFCDWYLEIIKPDIKHPHNQLVMYKILEKFLRILHPFMPFVTEEIWQKLQLSSGERAQSIMASPWPHIQQNIINKKMEKKALILFDAVTQVRTLRSSLEIKPEEKVEVSIYGYDLPCRDIITANKPIMETLCKIKQLNLLTSNKRPASTVSTVSRNMDIYLHFSGLLDVKSEQEKLKKKISELISSKEAKENRLKNQEFIKKAPQEIIEKEKTGIEEIRNSLKRRHKMLNELFLL